MQSLSYTLNFVENAHKGQKRKFTDDPYIIHCFTVANIISGITDDVDMIYSALLHDILEDTKYSFMDLKKRFGDEVARIVDGLTEEYFVGKRKEKKQKYKEKIANGCYKIQTIKLADIFHNLHDIEEKDPVFAKLYFKEKKELLTVLDKGDKILFKQVENIINDYYERN